MTRARDVAFAVALVVVRVAGAESADEKPAAGLLGLGGGRTKDPITITADNLEYQYKDGVIVYRGNVLAVQGEVKVRSNELRIILAKSQDDGNASASKTAADLGDTSASKVQSVVATGKVRIDQGTRWAVGGKATFDQSNRTLVLTENPVLHDGPNEVSGDRVVVYLDQSRSVVEGGTKRVKAMLIPDKEGTGKPEPAP